MFAIDTLEEGVSCSYANQLHEAPGVWAETRGITPEAPRAPRDVGAHGIVASAAMVVDASGLAGGTAGRGLFDVAVDADLEALAGLGGTDVHAEVYGLAGTDGNALAGTLQGVSNIDADPFLRAAEVWAEHHFGPRVRVKAGRIDTATEFDGTDVGGVFVHPAMGTSPTLVAAHVYPAPAWGAVAGGVAGPVDARVGAWPDAEGGFGVAEVDVAWESGRAGVGAWGDRGAWARFDGGEQGTAIGGFAVAEQALFGGLAGFVKLGVADPAVAEVDAQVGGGLAWTGLLPRREVDVVAIASSWAHAPAASGRGPELAVEALYKAQVGAPAAVLVDVMTIRSEELGALWVGTVRTELAF